MISTPTSFASIILAFPNDHCHDGAYADADDEIGPRHLVTPFTDG